MDLVISDRTLCFGLYLYRNIWLPVELDESSRIIGHIRSKSTCQQKKRKTYQMAFYPSQADSDDSFDFLFKIVLIGDAGVGKTCVVQRFKSGTYVEKHGSTIGVDFTMKTLKIDGKLVKVIIIRIMLFDNILIDILSN